MRVVFELNPNIPFTKAVAQYHDPDRFPVFRPAVDAARIALTAREAQAESTGVPSIEVPSSASRVYGVQCPGEISETS